MYVNTTTWLRALALDELRPALKRIEAHILILAGVTFDAAIDAVDIAKQGVSEGGG